MWKNCYGKLISTISHATHLALVLALGHLQSPTVLLSVHPNLLWVNLKDGSACEDIEEVQIHKFA